jgi:hypothetical protein
VKKKKQIGLDFVVDKLTNSIENVVTGDSFTTEISLISVSDLKNITKKMIGFLTGKKNLSNLKEMFIN